MIKKENHTVLFVSDRDHLFFSDEKQMIRHSEKFFLLADIEVIAKILRIIFIVERVDPACEKFARAVGSDLMKDMHAAVGKNSAAPVERVKNEREIFKSEGAFIVFSGSKIIRTVVKLGQEDHIVPDESKKQFSAFFANSLCLRNALLFIIFRVKVVKRSENENNIKTLVTVAAQIDGVAFYKVDPVFGTDLFAKRRNIRICKFESADFIPFFREIQAVFARSRAYVENFVSGTQIPLDISDACQKFHPRRL